VEDDRRTLWGVAVTDVDFRLLGSMQLRVDAVPATLPGAAERGLLALLLLSAGRTVAATSLIDRLWSESALPTDPLNALQLRVSKLRRALAAHGLDLISRDASGYRRTSTRAWSMCTGSAPLCRPRACCRTTATTPAGPRLYERALGSGAATRSQDFAGQGWATVEAAPARADASGGVS
jgi:hypothetical protein